MRTPDQVKWDFVHQWLGKAQRDLKAAEVLLQGNLEDFDNVGFHAQQATEKFIKAYLVRHQVEFPKTHDIAFLRRLVARVDPVLSTSLAPADLLTPYGVEFRYPSDLPALTREQGTEVLQHAEQVRHAVLTHLSSYLEAGRP